MRSATTMRVVAAVFFLCVFGCLRERSPVAPPPRADASSTPPARLALPAPSDVPPVRDVSPDGGSDVSPDASSEAPFDPTEPPRA